MRLSRHHLVVWLTCAAVAAAIAVRACHTYNQFAGTDKTAAHVAAIAFAMLGGPLVGPFANSGQFGWTPGLLAWEVLLLVGVAVSLLPFLVVKDRPGTVVRFLAWSGYLTACAAWFGSAIVSLGMFLS